MERGGYARIMTRNAVHRTDQSEASGAGAARGRARNEDALQDRVPEGVDRAVPEDGSGARTSWVTHQGDVLSTAFEMVPPQMTELS